MMWVNIQSWEEGKSITVDFQEFNNSWGTSISLNSYIDVTSTNTWQRALIPLADFDISSYTYKRLRLTPTGDIGIYLDDVAFAVGANIYYAVPIGEYGMYADEFGATHILSVPTPDADIDDLKPSMRAGEKKPGMRAYPDPINL